MPTFDDSTAPKNASDALHHAANGSIGGSSSKDGEHKPPLLEDIMQLSRLGEIDPVKRLFDEGKFGTDHKDNEGITPLHVSNILTNSLMFG